MGAGSRGAVRLHAVTRSVKMGSQRLGATGEAALHRACRNAHDLGDLLDRKVVGEPQDQDGALARRECGQRRHERPVVFVHCGDGALAGGVDRVWDPIHGPFPPPRAAPSVDVLADQHPVGVGVHVSAAHDPRPSWVHRHQYVLHQVVSRRPVPAQQERLSAQRRGPNEHPLAESSIIRNRTIPGGPRGFDHDRVPSLSALVGPHLLIVMRGQERSIVLHASPKRDA